MSKNFTLYDGEKRFAEVLKRSDRRTVFDNLDLRVFPNSSLRGSTVVVETTANQKPQQLSELWPLVAIEEEGENDEDEFGNLRGISR